LKLLYLHLKASFKITYMMHIPFKEKKKLIFLENHYSL